MAEGIKLVITFTNRMYEPRLAQWAKDLLEEHLGDGYPHEIIFQEELNPMELAGKIKIEISPSPSTEAESLKGYIEGLGFEEVLEVTTE